MKKLVILSLFLSWFGFSQQESYYSLYQFNMQVINPAYAGAEANHMFSLLNRTQWENLDNSPRTMALAYSSKRENNVGLGLSVVSDRVFVEKQTFAYVDFSYMLDMDQTKVFLGIKAGGNFYQASSLNLEDYYSGVDPAQKELSRFNPNVGAGAYLKNPKYWISFSIPRLFNVKRDQDLNIGAKDRIHAYMGGGMNFPINDKLILKPSVMLRKVRALPLSADFTAFVSLQNKINYGISYRSNAAMSIMLFANLLEGIDVGYAYETPTEATLAGQSMKTHEIFFRIRLGEGIQTIEENTSTGGPINQ